MERSNDNKALPIAALFPFVSETKKSARPILHISKKAADKIK
jgi:hypothetical protein